MRLIFKPSAASELAVIMKLILQKMQKDKLSYAIAFYLMLLSTFNFFIYLIERNPDSKVHAFFIDDFTFPAISFAILGIIASLLIFFRFFMGLVVSLIPLSFMAIYFIYKWPEFNNKLSKSYFAYCYQGNKFAVFFVLTMLCLTLSIISIIKNKKLITKRL